MVMKMTMSMMIMVGTIMVAILGNINDDDDENGDDVDDDIIC